MVDNFDKIAEWIDKQMAANGQEGDCYYLQLLRRQADDPKIDGKQDPKYHGNMHSRSIKDYLIKSSEHLMDVKDDIMSLCKMFNVRAYIRLNKRNYKNIALEMLKHIAEQCASGETYSSPFHLVASACGQCCQAGKDKTWLVDLDKEFLPYEKEIIDIICECQPISNVIQTYSLEGMLTLEKAKEWYLNQKFLILPTKNGKHIICPPFNKMTFQQMWDKSENLKQLDMLDIHKDNPTILYVP